MFLRCAAPAPRVCGYSWKEDENEKKERRKKDDGFTYLESAVSAGSCGGKREDGR